METNLSLKNKPGPPRGRGGRPRKDDALHSSMKVSTTFLDEIKDYRKPNERLVDTLRRIVGSYEKMKWRAINCDRCKGVLDELDE
jgi:hypothetical protein